LRPNESGGWLALFDGATSVRSNLSYRLVAAVADRFPGSVHVRDVGLARADDRTVWTYARANALTIVTKDSDFNQTAFLVGAPPKIVWLRIGNCTTDEVLALLDRRATDIKEFIDSADDIVLVVGEE
jgi:predicted nuclease of predicted toxin-antitoxin system